jgi:hypothetical protein
MAVREIRELFLFKSYKIFVFYGTDSSYGISRTGTVTYDGKFVETEFTNERKNTSHHKMLGRVSNLTDKKCEAIFKDPRFSEQKSRLKEGSKYPNYEDKFGRGFDSALESIKSYLRAEGWEHPLDETWIIIPKPPKKLTGQKLEIEFDLCPENFGNGSNPQTLNVYMTKVKKDTREIKFSVEIPDFIYEFLLEHPEEEERPTSKIIESQDFSQLRSMMYSFCNTARSLKSFDDKLKKAQKIIVINFGSNQKDERDGYAFVFFPAYPNA